MTASGADAGSSLPAILKRVVSNAGKLLGGRAINAVLGLGAMALAARALGVRDLGVLVLIQAFGQFLAEVVEFQSWQTVLQYGAGPLADGRREDFQRVLRFSVVLDAASAALGVTLGSIGAFLLAGRLGWSAGDAPGAALYMLSLVFMVSATPLGLLRLFDRFDVMARQAALISLIRLIGCGVAYGLGSGVNGFLLAWAIGAVGSWLYLAGSAFGELRRRDLLQGFRWRGPLAHEMPGVWRFAWNTNLASALDVALTHLATLFIGALIGPAQAAFWRVGRQVADAVAKPARLLTPALFPELARLRADGRSSDMWRLSRDVGLLAGGIGVLLLGITAVAGPALLSLVMGQAFAPAAEVMTWQVGAAVLGIAALPLEPLLVSLGKPGAAAVVRLSVGAAFLSSLPFLVRHFGLIGAGAGLTAATGALALGMLWLILREARIRRAAVAPETDTKTV